MATVPLNTFKTVTANVTTTPTDIYTSPTGTASIILTAQIANVTNTSGTVTLSHVNGPTITELIKDYSIPGNDAVSGITGKLVLEAGHKIRISSNANNKMKITLSILESANE